jgi:hypothetical protein
LDTSDEVAEARKYGSSGQRLFLIQAQYLWREDPPRVSLEDLLRMPRFSSEEVLGTPEEREFQATGKNELLSRWAGHLVGPERRGGGGTTQPWGSRPLPIPSLYARTPSPFWLRASSFG